MAVSLSRRLFVLPAVRVTPVVGVGADVLVIVGLIALAGVIRWPKLLLSPQFPSVADTALRALAVADGRAFYLADSAPYLGAPFLYLLAAVYALAGPSVEATLLVPWAIGTLTVVPTYLLGREVGGRVAGLVAGALVATSSAHTVISSHVPLSHSLTPLVATTTLWLLAWALRQTADRPVLGLNGRAAPTSPRASISAHRGGRMLALAGLGAGLSLQTHPTVLPLLLGAGLGALALRPHWLRTRWPAIALACVVLGYSTLLAHHIGSRFEVVGDVEGKQARYLNADQDAGEGSERGVYLNNLEQLGLSVIRLASGAILDREDAAAYLTDGWVLVYPVLAVAGLVAGARRGAGWLAPGVVLMLLLPPVLSGKYKPILDGRYLMPLVPVLFVGIGLAFAEFGRLLDGPRTSAATDGVAIPFRTRAPARSSTVRSLSRSVALAGLVVGALVLVARPAALLDEFYEESMEDGFSNALYLRTLDQVRAARIEGEAVILDDRLREVKSLGGGNAGTSFAWLLAVSRIPTEPLAEAADPRAFDGHLAILQRATAERLGGQLTLAPLDGRRPTGRDPQGYRAYRLGVKGEAAASTRP